MTPALEKKVIKPATKFVEDFKQFIVRGNAADLAIAVVVGAAGGRVITSFVSDIVTPTLALLIGRVNFDSMFLNLSETHYASLDEAKKAGAATINYGSFLNVTLDFILVAFVIFLIVKALNRLRSEAPPAAGMKECPHCLSMVKAAATRCAFCTAELPVAAE